MGEPGDPADSIPQGRRLVRQEGGGVSLSDRLAARFYRLIWQTPIHKLKLKGHHPLKLAGVPDDPVAGRADRGAELLEGEFRFQGVQADAASAFRPTAAASPAFRAWIDSFAWLRDLATQGRPAAASSAEQYVQRWLNTHGEVLSEPAWRPDVAARRILYWAAYAPLILSGTDLVHRSSVLNHIARVSRHLDRTADRMLPGATRIMAWCGVVAAGLIIPGNEPRRLFGEAGLAKALESGLGDDGGVICRAPDMQMVLVDTLLMLRAAYAMRKLDPPQAMLEALASSASMLAATLLGDGALSSWQGSVPADGAGPLLDAVAPIVRPARVARGWGYQRLAAGKTILLIDTAPPTPSHVSRHGCASTLAFELSSGEDRIVVNCGGARSASLAAAPALADGLRTTAAHSTLIVADSNSTAIHKGGQIGKGVIETMLDRSESEAGSKLEASHDGYLKRFGFQHQRILTLSADGQELRGEDVLVPGGRKVKGDTHFTVRFHLAPGIDVSPTADELGALLQIGDGKAWQFRARGGQLLIDESVWIGPEGEILPTSQLVIMGRAQPGGASVGWAFRQLN